MKKTIITHIYNEEFLLPWWLNHHKQFFEDGIIIDYASTDRSVEICKDICPTWHVFSSGNKDFQAHMIDAQVCHFERQLDGWRIALNVTEFLVGDLNKAMHDLQEPTQYLIPSIAFFDWNPEGTLDKEQPLWAQKKMGITYKKDFQARRGRSLHNVDNMVYDVGRHFPRFNYEDVLIFHYGNCISSPEMVNRRLQIQHRIPEQDKRMGLGHQHHNNNKGMDINSLKEFNERENNKIEDCSEYILKYTGV